MRYAAILFFATYFPIGVAYGQSSNPGEVPKIIVAGLDAYRTSGPDEAMKAWLKGSPIEGSKDAMTQANALRQVQDYYGTYQAFDIVETKDISPTTRVVYLVLDYEKGPLFARFMVYRAAGQAWTMTSFTFNTHVDAVLPAGTYQSN